MLRRSIIVVAVLLAGTAHAPAHVGNHEVQVDSNFFDPRELAVDPGETITWALVDGRHTVTSDQPGLFGSGTLDQPSQTFEWTAPAHDAWIFYHCAVHGSPGDGEDVGRGMAAAIKVGDPPPLPSRFEVRSVPSDTWASLGEALTSLNQRTRYRIELAPGTYPASQDLTPQTLFSGGTAGTRYPAFELTIRGMGGAPGDVVLDGDGPSALSSTVDGVYVENLTVTGATGAALDWADVHRFGAVNVVIEGTPRFGVRARRSRLGTIRRAHVDGAMVAGISIEDCVECDLNVDDVTVVHSLQGLSALNAGALVVQRSTFSDNGVGIAIKTTPGAAAPARGAHIAANTIARSTDRSVEPPPPSERMDLPVGAGVWIGGASHVTVESNDISGSSYGIVVTGAAAFGRVVSNTVADSMHADLAWDGIGADVCFAANESEDGDPPTSEPDNAQTLYDCALPATVGVPMPNVTATVLAWGLGAQGP